MPDPAGRGRLGGPARGEGDGGPTRSEARLGRASEEPVAAEMPDPAGRGRLGGPARGGRRRPDAERSEAWPSERGAGRGRDARSGGERSAGRAGARRATEARRGAKRGLAERARSRSRQGCPIRRGEVGWEGRRAEGDGGPTRSEARLGRASEETVAAGMPDPAGRDWRPGSESNRRTRLCRPLHDHSATWPRRLPGGATHPGASLIPRGGWLGKGETPACGVSRRWSGKRDSNSRPRPWQGRALPTELFPRREPSL
jgi:hypothetical protein